MIQIAKTLSFEISRTKTAAGPMKKREGKNKLAVVCDNAVVSPLNVFLSIMSPRKQTSSHMIKGERKYNKFRRRVFKRIFMRIASH